MGSNVPGRFIDKPSLWRRVSSVAWQSPNDPTIYGMLDVDASAALAYLDKLRKETGEQVTITHLVVKAVGLTLRRHPECNAYLRFRRIYQRDCSDVFVLVSQPPAGPDVVREQRADLSGVRLSDVDALPLLQIASQLTQQGALVRKGRDLAVGPLKRMVAWLPKWLGSLGIRLVTFVQYELNRDLSAFGIPRDTFAGAMVTSMGMMGIKYAFAPLVPAMRHSVVLAVGRVEDRPVVRDGEVVIRPILPLTATLDHRVIDGYQASRLAATLSQLLEDPEGQGL
jgi:pyruvate/2-oxoglutarate dehydrogenase complex dihydrolipoamide acyltransferase (E2) component